jgi:hypothetical protein
MSYVNLPDNIRDIFYNLSDRVTKLETGPNAAMYQADSVQGLATDAYAQSLIAGNQATQAALQAGVAQTTADGKNTVHYSTSTPGSTANKVGDIWYQYGTSGTYANKVIAQWTGAGGTSWTSVTVSGLVIANIDAGTITTGTLTSIAIYAGSSGQFQVSAAGALSATSATIQGTITASSGTIGGFTLGAGYLNYGTAYLYSGGSSTYALYDSTRGIYAHDLSAAYDLDVGGVSTQQSGTFNSSLTVKGHLVAYNTIATDTSSSSANTVVSATSGIIYRSTSSMRYKVAIEPQTISTTSILALEPKSYVDKREADEKGSTDGLPRYLGLIAEDVAQIDTLKDLLVVYNQENQPDAINYDRVAIALIPLLKDHEARLNKLEGK